ALVLLQRRQAPARAQPHRHQEGAVGPLVDPPMLQSHGAIVAGRTGRMEGKGNRYLGAVSWSNGTQPARSPIIRPGALSDAPRLADRRRHARAMPTKSLLDRLHAGEVLLMDGATGSELQRRGVDVSRGATRAAPPGEGAGVWSGAANLEAPDVVRQIHEE